MNVQHGFGSRKPFNLVYLDTQKEPINLIWIDHCSPKPY